MFSGLRSRWIIPLECKYSKALKIYAAKNLTVSYCRPFGDVGPHLFSINDANVFP